MPGARVAPAASRAKIKKQHELVTTVTPETPGIPHAMVLTLISRSIPPVTGLVCHRRRRILPPNLMPGVGASGPHDFAVRGSTSFVADVARVHRIPHPTSVTIAQTPLLRGTG